ncbi:MAG: hypothetical protein ACXWEI_19115, partial [Mycobacterium sp.]
MNPIGALIEVISRRAGLDNVVDEAVGKTRKTATASRRTRLPPPNPAPARRTVHPSAPWPIRSRLGRLHR